MRREATAASPKKNLLSGPLPGWFIVGMIVMATITIGGLFVYLNICLGGSRVPDLSTYRVVPKRFKFEVLYLTEGNVKKIEIDRIILAVAGGLLAVGVFILQYRYIDRRYKSGNISGIKVWSARQNKVNFYAFLFLTISCFLLGGTEYVNVYRSSVAFRDIRSARVVQKEIFGKAVYITAREAIDIKLYEKVLVAGCFSGIMAASYWTKWRRSDVLG